MVILYSSCPDFVRGRSDPPLSRFLLRERRLWRGSRSSYSREACRNGEGWRPLRTPVLRCHLPPIDRALSQCCAVTALEKSSDSFAKRRWQANTGGAAPPALTVTSRRLLAESQAARRDNLSRKQKRERESRRSRILNRTYK